MQEIASQLSDRQGPITISPISFDPHKLVEQAKSATSLTQKELAVVVGISEFSLGRMKRAVTVMPQRVRWALEAILKANMQPVLSDDEDLPSAKEVVTGEAEVFPLNIDYNDAENYAGEVLSSVVPLTTAIVQERQQGTPLKHLVATYLEEASRSKDAGPSTQHLVLAACDTLIRGGLWRDNLSIQDGDSDEFRWRTAIVPYLQDIIDTRTWISTCEPAGRFQKALLEIAPLISMCRMLPDLISNGVIGSLGIDEELSIRALDLIQESTSSIFMALNEDMKAEVKLISWLRSPFALPTACLLTASERVLANNAQMVLLAKAKYPAPELH
jgi:hypothetical protein